MHEDQMYEFVEAQAPCFTMGFVREQNKDLAFIALRPGVQIPKSSSGQGFSFGSGVFGGSDYPLFHFAFHFYDFATFNALVNPDNPIARKVLARMVETGDCFFFALDSKNSLTAFRSGFASSSQSDLRDNLDQYGAVAIDDQAYDVACRAFQRAPEPPGTFLTWVCNDQPDYLDVGAKPLDLSPS